MNSKRHSTRSRITKSILYFASAAFLLSRASWAGQSPSFVYQAKLYDSTGSNPLTGTINVYFQIYDPTGTCLLYEELQSGIVLGSDGILSANVGTALGNSKRIVGTDPGLTMSMIYSNAGMPLTGRGTSGSCTYTPTSGDSRVLRVSWNDGVHPSNPLPPQTLGTVPSAITADSLDGLTASQFIQSDSTVTQAHLDTLTNGSDASALHNHDSLYLRVNNSSSFNAGSGTFYTTGKIGIGTSTPLNALDIVGTPSVDGSDQALIGTFDSRPLNAGTGGGIEFGGVYDGSGDRTDWASLKGIKENSTSGDTSAALVFSTAGATGPGSATEKMRISSTGNVGIGATLPSSALDLNGAFTIEGIAAPSVSPAGQGRMYYDSTSNSLKLSINGGAYSPVVTGTSGSYVSKAGDTMTGALNINSGAITTSAPALNTTQTWNNAATIFTGALENITNTASNAASKLIDLQVGGVSKFNADVSGNVNATTYYGDGSHLTGLVSSVNWPVPGTIGSTTPNTGAFTTLNASSLSTTGNITDNGTLLMPTAPAASAVASSIDLGTAIAGGNANGTYVGINAANGYAGDLVNLEVNGVSKFKVDASGNVNATGTFTGNGSGLTNVTAGTLNLGNQTANTVFAGPATGPVAVAGFRALVDADIPFAAPGPIGSTTPSTAAFTTLSTTGNVTDGGTLGVTGASTFTGNVGIGAAATSGQLQLTSTTAANPSLFITKADSGTTNQSGGTLTFENNQAAGFQRNAGTIGGEINFNYNAPTSGTSTTSGQIISLADVNQSGNSVPSALAFSTWNSAFGIAERARITSSGGLDIGTTTAADTLNVNGGERLGSLVATPATLTAAMTTASTTIPAATATYPFSGTVLIDNEVIVYGTKSSANAFATLTRGAYGTTAAAHASGATMYIYHELVGNSTTATPQFAISSNGNIGIKTLTPAYPLDVNGNVHATAFYGDGSNLTNIGSGSINWTTPGTIGSATANTGAFTTLNASSLSTTGNITDGGTLTVSGAGTSSFVGSVGVGTTSPLAELDAVATSGFPKPLIGFRHPGSGDWGITLGNEAISNVYIGCIGSACTPTSDYYWRANWSTVGVATNTFQTPVDSLQTGLTTVNVQGISGQTGDMLDITSNGGSMGNLFKVDHAGNVVAAGTFTGNGSGLTNVTAGTLNLGNQTANTIYAGPATGPAAIAGFRALASADIPWTAPGTIGSGTASSGAFTTLSASGKLSLPTTPSASSSSSSAALGSAIASGNANGTYVGINAASGYAGDFANYEVNGTSEYKVDGSGNVTATAYYGDGSHLTGIASSTNWAVPGTIGSTTPNTGAFTTLNATGASSLTGDISGPQGMAIKTFPGSWNAAWIDMPTSGPSGIGTGGAGANAWIAYVFTGNEWFSGTNAGDVAYRNALGQKIYIGIDNGGGTGAPTMTFSGSNVGVGNVSPAYPVDVVGTVNATTFRGSGASLTSIPNSALTVAATRRTCMIIVGADNGALLGTTDIAPQLAQCYIPEAATIVEVNVRADAGTPNVQLARRHGTTATSILSAVLPTAAAGAAACSLSAAGTCIDGTTAGGVTLSTTSLSAGDWIETSSSTSSSTAHRMSIAVVYTVN